MTDEQKKWLAEHPKYSVVREFPVVGMIQWTDKGYLTATGRFVPDDGRTFFTSDFRSRAFYVGREYRVC